MNMEQNKEVENNEITKKTTSQQIITRIRELNESMKQHGGGVEPTDELVKKIGSNTIRQIDCVPCGLNMWRISEFLVIIGECSFGKSTEKNNFTETVKYLDKNFGDDYLVYVFRKQKKCNENVNIKENKIKSNTEICDFKNMQIYEDIRFDLNMCLEIARTSRCWKKIRSKGVIVIEMKEKLSDKILLVISILLSYNNTYVSAVASYERMIRSYSEIFKNSSIVLRYARYYDKLVKIRSRHIPRKYLSQVIISTKPDVLIGSLIEPILLICWGDKRYEIRDNCYIDDNFIVFSHLDIEIRGEVTFSLLFENREHIINIFELCLNSHFYGRGMYRFMKEDIITTNDKCGIQKCISDDFLIDLIFVEDNEDEGTIVSFDATENIQEELKVLMARMRLSCNAITDSVITRYFKQQRFKIADINLNNKDFKNENIVCNNTTSNIITINNIDNIINYTSTDLNNNIISENKEFFYDIGFVIEKKIEIPQRVIKKKLFQKLKQKQIIKNELQIIAIKPLHWEELSNRDFTFFEDIQHFDSQINYNDFEDCFCVDATTGRRHTPPLIQKRPDEGQRLFFISLALRHLELKSINAQNLIEIFNNRAEILEAEDLLNIDRLVLKRNEFNLLAEVQYDKLSIVEKAVLQFNQINQLKENIDIFLFSRRFSDGIILLEKLLKEFEITIEKLLNNSILKFILKLVLDLGNAINYKYSTKNRICLGFKIDSLPKCMSYRGTENIRIVDFIINNLLKRNIDLHSFVNDFISLDSLKKEEFPVLKVQINNYILEYKEKLAIFVTLDNIGKQRHRKFLLSVYESLTHLCIQHNKCQDLINTLVVKFGELESKSIDKIINILSEIIQMIKSSLDKKI